MTDVSSVRRLFERGGRRPPLSIRQRARRSSRNSKQGGRPIPRFLFVAHTLAPFHDAPRRVGAPARWREPGIRVRTSAPALASPPPASTCAHYWTLLRLVCPPPPLSVLFTLYSDTGGGTTVVVHSVLASHAAYSHLVQLLGQGNDDPKVW